MALTRWLLAALVLLGLCAGGARAQNTVRLDPAAAQPASADEPVTFSADTVTYDRANDIIEATGHVQAWQNQHTLYADAVRFDRNTNVADAQGHVVLVQPDGQVMFADYAELTGGMRDAVIKGLRAQLAENGKVAANGGRRFAGSDAGQISEMTRAVYTTCDLCKQDPNQPPLWQIRARSVVEDSEHHRLEFNDAFVDLFGVPIGYFPYFYTIDPTISRGDGFLMPAIGTATHIGAFWSQPYYMVLDGQSDLTLSPTLTSNQGVQLGAEYRRMFNDGQTTIDGALANDYGTSGYLFAKGQFNYNDTWRYGFDINVASSSNYLRDYRVPTDNEAFLQSSLYAEGFGQGSYARADTISFQGLTNQVVSTALPLVLPRFQYSFFSEPDALGGRFNISSDSYNIYRSEGTRTQRSALVGTYELPFNDTLGGLWKFSLHGTAAAYEAQGLNLAPNYSPIANATAMTALPQGALEWRMPFARADTATGRQVIEPILQLMVTPNVGGSMYNRIPNEDSLDLQFTDENLFAWNRYPGIDRQQGGTRINAGLHTAWYFPNGGMLDAMFGDSYQFQKDPSMPTGSGLTDYQSDYVGRITLAPTSWIDFTGRGRFDHVNGTLRYAEAISGVGDAALRVNVGYIYTTTDPFTLYDFPPVAGTYNNIFAYPRNEALVSASTRSDPYKLTGYARYDVQNQSLVETGATVSWENECMIVSFNAYRRYTSINGDSGAEAFLFQVTLKTVGQFGFHAF